MGGASNRLVKAEAESRDADVTVERSRRRELKYSNDSNAKNAIHTIDRQIRLLTSGKMEHESKDNMTERDRKCIQRIDETILSCKNSITTILKRYSAADTHLSLCLDKVIKTIQFCNNKKQSSDSGTNSPVRFVSDRPSPTSTLRRPIARRAQSPPRRQSRSPR